MGRALLPRAEQLVFAMSVPYRCELLRLLWLGEVRPCVSCLPPSVTTLCALHATYLCPLCFTVYALPLYFYFRSNPYLTCLSRPSDQVFVESYGFCEPRNMPLRSSYFPSQSNVRVPEMDLKGLRAQILGMCFKLP